MKFTKYLLIGNGLASFQAAKQLRKKDSESPITMVGGEPYIPYSRPPLSKEFLQGEGSRKDLFFEPEQFYHDQGIDLILGVPVEQIDLSEKVATLVLGETITFEKALFATGGRPVHPNIPGQDFPGVFYLRTLDDAAKIADYSTKGKKAVVIGAGFIGLEVAASLTQRGVHVTVVEAESNIWSRFADPFLGGFIQEYCEKKGITFLTGEKVNEILRKNHLLSLVTSSGKNLFCDFVCIGVGIVPNVEVAQKAGLKVDDGIVVNEYLQSSDPDIFAVGDVANYLDPIFGKRRRVEHWGHAEYCGQLAGQNMAGEKNKYDLLTYVWSDIFDLHLEFAGDESEHDRILLRGSISEKSFTVLYLKKNIMKAYFSINGGSKDYPHLQRLIRERKDLTGKEGQLQDSGFPMNRLF